MNLDWTKHVINGFHDWHVVGRHERMMRAICVGTRESILDRIVELKTPYGPLQVLLDGTMRPGWYVITEVRTPFRARRRK